MSADEILTTIPQQEIRDYPDPQTLPVPPSSSQQPRPPLVALSELIPGKYASTTARIVYLKTIERQDALGKSLSKPCLSELYKSNDKK
jgi:hypothetical protein